MSPTFPIDERAILAALLKGETGPENARALGMSESSYQRRIADLKGKYKANTLIHLAALMSGRWIETDVISDSSPVKQSFRAELVAKYAHDESLKLTGD